jgi:hypothetical protein
MDPIRTFSIISWIALPTVMFGGFSLLGLIVGGELSPFQQTFFRAGHAHAGVLLLMSLLYYNYLGRTTVTRRVKQTGCRILLLGVLAQSGGFFLHMAVGAPGRPSTGTVMTSLGVLLLAVAIVILVYAMIVTPAEPRHTV